MEMKKKVALGAAAVLAAGAGAAGIAVAGSGDDNEAPIKGSALEKASDAALAETGEGTVTETETGDEESYYEVEVTLDNGDQVDVQVNRDFEVVGSAADVEEQGDSADENEAGDEQETADDATDEGPDMDPTEPGHQDEGPGESESGN
jgi:hypothetical protein